MPVPSTCRMSAGGVAEGAVWSHAEKEPPEWGHLAKAWGMSLSFEMKPGLERTKRFHAAWQPHTGGHSARKRLLPTSHFHNGVSALKLSSEEAWLTPCSTQSSWVCSWGKEVIMDVLSQPPAPGQPCWSSSHCPHWPNHILLPPQDIISHHLPAAQKPQRFSIALNKSTERSKYPRVQNGS